MQEKHLDSYLEHGESDVVVNAVIFIIVKVIDDLNPNLPSPLPQKLKVHNSQVCGWVGGYYL